jgi:hypothetical protein
MIAVGTAKNNAGLRIFAARSARLAALVLFRTLIFAPNGGLPAMNTQDTHAIVGDVLHATQTTGELAYSMTITSFRPMFRIVRRHNAALASPPSA